MTCLRLCRRCCGALPCSTVPPEPDRAAAEIAASGGDPRDEAALIDAVYTLRKGQFASSTPGVRAAVHSRFDDERRQALAMLREGSVTA